MSWLDITGWLGSALLVYSVMQARVLRFRVLNLAACVLLAGFNAALSIWPMVAMNIALCAINLWHIRRLLLTRHDPAAYDLLVVDPQDTYLHHVLTVHRTDIAAYQPDLAWDGRRADDLAILIQKGDETVGVVLLHAGDGGVAQVDLDYVTPRFRDFSPGEFVWNNSTLLRARGFTRVVTPRRMVDPYYGKLGFDRRDDGSYERAL